MIALADVVACPRCDQPLEGNRCNACSVDFPFTDGMPWLVADPAASRYEWKLRFQMAIADLAHRAQTARSALAPELPAPTRTRLETLASGYERQQRALEQLLPELGVVPSTDLATYLALKVRLPTHMGLMSYDANVFRDWVWGEAENAAALDAVSEPLGSASTLLVLGAGAGRLAYDLHQASEAELTVALELNPYLARVAAVMAAGGSIELVEFPRAPTSGSKSAIVRTLTSPGAARGGFNVVLADASRPPFRPHSFDVVLTPWLLDVMDTAPEVQAQLVNRLLKPGGQWIYHGSLAPQRPDVIENINVEELEALMAGTGFELRHRAEVVLPYMDSPDSRHGRRESVLTLAATKTAAVEPPPRQQNLPDWIAKGRAPIPALPAFQSQAMATRVHAFIMSLIDGKRSLKDMAAVMEEQRLMPKDEAEAALRGFLIKMFEEANSGGSL